MKGGHQYRRKRGAVRDRAERVEVKQAQTPSQHHALGPADVALQGGDVTSRSGNSSLILTVAERKGTSVMAKEWKA